MKSKLLEDSYWRQEDGKLVRDCDGPWISGQRVWMLILRGLGQDKNRISGK